MPTVYQTLSPKAKEIFDVSVKLFYENGFTETSVRDIAEKMNLKAASLYNHVDSKETILNWIITNYIDMVTNALKEFQNKEMSFAEQFHFMVEKNISISIDKKMQSDIFKRYLKLADEGLQQRYIDFSVEYRKNLSQALEHFKIYKHSSFDPELAANFLIFSMNNIYKWIPEGYTKEQLIDLFENKLFYTLTGKKLSD